MLEQSIINLVNFVNNIVIPFLLGIAFLIFVVNVVRYFIIGGANADSREKARSVAVYSVLAFVLIVIFWGVVTMLASSIGLSDHNAISSDYVEINNGGTNAPPYCPPEGGPC